MGINKVILVGRVGKDPDIKLINEKNLAKFSFVTDESYKDKQGVKQTKSEWHQISTWNQTMCNVIENYVTKGQMLYIEGKIRYKNYEKDGVKKYFTEIELVKLEMLGKKKEAEQRNEPPDIDESDYTV